LTLGVLATPRAAVELGTGETGGAGKMERAGRARADLDTQGHGILTWPTPVATLHLDLPLGDGSVADLRASALSQPLQVKTADGQQADYVIDVSVPGFRDAVIGRLMRATTGNAAVPEAAAEAPSTSRGVALLDFFSDNNPQEPRLALRHAATLRAIEVVAVAVKSGERAGRVCTFDYDVWTNGIKTSKTNVVTTKVVDADVRLVDARTGKELRSERFSGGSADKCPTTSEYGKAVIDGPSDADILAWAAR
jgi:hypothetical protein